MKHRKTSLVVAATSLLVLPASAATLVGYDFNSDFSQTTGTATGSDVSYGSFTGGSASNIGRSSFSNTLFVRTNATGNTATDGDTLAKAITNNAYAGFTLTNTTGETVDLTNLTFDIWFTAPGAINTYEMYVMSDAAAFTAGNELGGVVYDTTLVSAPVEAGPATITTDLSSLGNLATSDSIEYRIYFVDDTNSADPLFRVDNITVTGVAIPEPSSILLSGMALAGLALRRRR